MVGLMNGGPEFTKAAIEHGMPPALTEANVRYLGEAEEVPRLRRGRPSPKKHDAVWGASHYAIGLLAFGTILPVNAAETAQALGSYQWVRTTKHRVMRNEVGERTGVVVVEEDTESPNGINLRSSITRLVALFASKTVEDREEALAVFVEHAIVLSVDAGTASISYQYEDDYWSVDYYRSPDPQNGGSDRRTTLRRKVSVELPLSLVVVCGGLLAETLAARTTSLPFPPSDKAPASAEPDPQNENAAIPARTAADTRKRNRPRCNATGANFTSPKTRGVGDIPQPSSSLRPVICPKRTMTHDVARSLRP